MVSVMLPHQQQHFNTMSPTNEQDFTLYPEPPQSAFPTTPMDMNNMPAEAYNTFPRTIAQHDMYASHNPVGFEQWTEMPHGFLGQSSPSMPSAYDEAELQVPPSNISTASIPSASSSAAGSPQSHPGQLAPMNEWPQAQGLGVTPGIVNPDYYSGTEYQAFAPGMEEFPQFEVTLTKAGPGYVGESAKVFSQQQQCSISSPSPTIVPSEPGLEQDSLISPVSPAGPSSRRTSLAFVPVTPPSGSSFSPLSPHRPAHMAQCSSFFSQSSGHFVPPLESSYPSILHPEMARPMAMPGYDTAFQSQNSAYPPPSPAMSSSPQPPFRTGSQSPYMPSGGAYSQPFSPFQPPVDARRQSVVSFVSNFSHEQPSHSGDESSKEKQRCPHPDCGKTFKDLKAHMLTHQNERPEKCPITTCDYHIKGFARKYDKNRHTLTHYKGTMVCGFCPGSGSAAEKSFNRADVFKRHLTAVHGVEQTPPNSRKKTSGAVNSGKKLTGYAPDATGKCSTCSATFSNAQDFYEHLDDCVLRIVQQEDPAEAINAKRLAEVENDKSVHETLEKNQLPITTPATSTTIGDEDEDEEMGEEDEDEVRSGAIKSPGTRRTVKTGPANGIQKAKGLTHSRGGVSLPPKSRGRKNRRDYPSSWGFDKGQMTMKKRVMAVFDGQRRLAKDDMMLSTEHEVRVKLSDGKAYVTDLDVQTMKRAEGFLNASEEEKGPWVSDDPTEDDIQTMLQLQQATA